MLDALYKEIKLHLTYGQAILPRIPSNKGVK